MYSGLRVIGRRSDTVAVVLPDLRPLWRSARVGHEGGEGDRVYVAGVASSADRLYRGDNNVVILVVGVLVDSRGVVS